MTFFFDYFECHQLLFSFNRSYSLSRIECIHATGLVVEGSFSVFTGYSAFQRTAEQSEDTYEMISKVPLCSGRSAVAEGLCDDWIEITRNQIPDLFWQNLQDETLRDVRAWKAIHQFCDNCTRRRHYEAYIRQRRGITDPNVPIVLPRNVPECNEAYKKQISRVEAEKLVSDRK